LILVFRMSRQS